MSAPDCLDSAEFLDDYYDSSHHPTKRLKVNDGDSDFDSDEEGRNAGGSDAGDHDRDQDRDQDRDRDRPRSQYKTAPSPVVHVRALCDSVIEADLVKGVDRFGLVSYVMMLPNKRQALVEFQDLQSAQKCVAYSKRRIVTIAGHPAFFNFSTSQRITRPGGPEDPKHINNVLFLSIQNPLYPITTDVLYTVCNACGPVLRIVIFKKNGIQALVEFDSVQSAQKAKASLNGADIYSGCCTLKIEYAKPTRLNIFKNDSESWDYTNPDLTARDERRRQGQPALLGDHPSTYGGFQPNPLALPHRMDSRASNSRPVHLYSAPDYEFVPQGKVIMIYGLNPHKMNCEKVFNLLCLYGNVEKVKFMKSMPDAAMVEMGDEFSVDRAITHLNCVEMFEKRINLCVSKQASIVPSQSYELADGTDSYKEFTNSRNNRFTNPGQAAKNRIQPPSNVLHFFNAPLCVTEEYFQEVCEECDLRPFKTFKTFTGKSDRSLSGVLEWESKNEAVEALTVLNHYQMKNTNGPYPYTLKLCFSTMSHA
ncbi:heterogeneous nuclear ribonucleoprotein L-like [Amblyraja radiata]|uniref:heterogeneous nuclear ribonucleoprotein L-like n=1 Tax=Amblyraja radiata TaxID=386614 RepID=UPI00140342BE|nr:heterogeneous nuclear ribonucleoprotein L-like [Amblyraja radiata]